MLATIAIGAILILAIGVVSRYFEAGAGLAELGRGIQTMISAPLSPQITPRFEPYLGIQVSEDIRNFIEWIQGAAAGYQPITPGGPIITPKLPIFPLETQMLAAGWTRARTRTFDA